MANRHGLGDTGDIDARSEKWQTSPVGEAYAAWLEPYKEEELIETVTLRGPRAH